MAITINGTSGITYPDNSIVATGNGSRNLVTTITGTNVASLATTVLSGYRNYELVFENLLPVTQSVTLYFQLYGGGAYLNAAAGYQSMGYGIFNNNTGAFHSVSATQLSMTYPSYFITTASGGSGICGTMYLYNVTGSTYKTWDYKVNGPTYTTGYTALYIGGGWYTASTVAITGFQMYASSGNITGTVRAYGYN